MGLQTINSSLAVYDAVAQQANVLLAVAPHGRGHTEQPVVRVHCAGALESGNTRVIPSYHQPMLLHRN
jgi:hypothetical protein